MTVLRTENYADRGPKVLTLRRLAPGGGVRIVREELVAARPIR